nr:hypothetical protein [Tanacetum cinerariifolium]
MNKLIMSSRKQRSSRWKLMIQTILLGLHEDIYVAVDSCETAPKIWLRVQHMMKGFDTGIQEKKAKLFNEWERFTSTGEESIKSYYHRFSKLMNDFKRNKHFPEKIASNLKFLNNLQPEWSRHVTILHQTKDLHTADYTQLYDFLKYNQKKVDELRAERLAKAQDPLALTANSKNPFNYLVFHPYLSSSSTFMQQPLPNNNYISQPSFNQNYIQQPMPNLEDITDPTAAINMTLMVRGNGRNKFRQYAGQIVGNQGVQNVVHNPSVRNVKNQNRVIVVSGIANLNGNGNVIAARAEGNAIENNANQTQQLIAQKKEAGIQLQAEEFDLMATATDLDEIEEYFELLEPIPEPHQVSQNESNVIYEVSSGEPGGRTVGQHSANIEETRAYHESLFHNLAAEVEKVNSVNRKMKETNADLTTELARYKNQEKCFEISQEKYEKLERCYQKSIYQQQCLTKRINALHLSFGKQITTLNEEISNLNKQLSKGKSKGFLFLKKRKG